MDVSAAGEHCAAARRQCDVPGAEAGVPDFSEASGLASLCALRWQRAC